MSTPLRVAVIARSVRPLHGDGGLEQSVYDLVRHLAARHVQVTLIAPPPAHKSRTPQSDPFGSSRVSIETVPYRTFPFANRPGTTILDRSTAYPLFGKRAGRRALELARAGEIDIVHAFGASGLGYALGRTAADPPLVLNPQGLEEFGASAVVPPLLKHLAYAPLRAAVRKTAAQADVIIATDHSLEPVVERHLKPRPGQMLTIPNGIDLTETAALAGPADGQRLRRYHGLREDDVVLLSVGRLEHNKGFDVMARALGQLARSSGSLSSHRWRWVLAGDGPYRAALEAVVQRESIDRLVQFAGRVSHADLHAWYEAANLFVHPTRYEGSSLVTLEAMAHWRAVIASRAGGLPDKVRPGVNGWLVTPESIDELAAAISAALSDWNVLAAMGSASRRLVEREFSWGILADRYVTMYEELRARNRRRSGA
jgi:glycogen synthase